MDRPAAQPELPFPEAVGRVGAAHATTCAVLILGASDSDLGRRRKAADPARDRPIGGAYSRPSAAWPLTIPKAIYWAETWIRLTVALFELSRLPQKWVYSTPNVTSRRTGRRTRGLPYQPRSSSMPKIARLTLFVALAALTAGSTAVTAAPSVGDALRMMAAGGEFRGFTRTLRGFEDHIWRFSPDGRVLATYTVRVDRGKRDFHFEGGAPGSWSIVGDRMCIRWNARYNPASGCYTIVVLENVSVMQGHYVRLIGLEALEGTVHR